MIIFQQESEQNFEKKLEIHDYHDEQMIPFSDISDVEQFVREKPKTKF